MLPNRWEEGFQTCTGDRVLSLFPTAQCGHCLGLCTLPSVKQRAPQSHCWVQPSGPPFWGLHTAAEPFPWSGPRRTFPGGLPMLGVSFAGKVWTQLPGRVPLDPLLASMRLWSSLCCSGCGIPAWGCGIPAWGCEPTLQGEGASQPTPLRASEPAPAPGPPLPATPLLLAGSTFSLRAPQTKYVQSAALVLVFKPAVHVSAVNPGGGRRDTQPPVRPQPPSLSDQIPLIQNSHPLSISPPLCGHCRFQKIHGHHILLSFH